MRQAGNLGQEELLDRPKLLTLLHERIETIDWTDAKADMHAFISAPSKLDIWSKEYFHALTEQLSVE